MANVWFIGDLHRGHKNIHKYRKQFESAEDHDEAMKEAYHNVVTKRDVVFFMGDTAFTHEALADVATWAGEKKILICGNHDIERGITMKDVANAFDEVYALRKYKEFWLSHAPMHPAELRGKVNIHGHVHEQSVNDARYFNTSLENIEFAPISLMALRERVNATLKSTNVWVEDERSTR